MRKKLDTRFPAARIKKIMQTDEDVGKIALAVPVLVSKALELFLQDLCDRSYDVTLQRGMKTLSSQHLKQCVHSFNVYDFLRDVVSKVPDMSAQDGGIEEKSGKRRGCDEDDIGEDMKRTRLDVLPNTGCSSIRGRGRGRGRRSSHSVDRDSLHRERYENDPETSLNHSDMLDTTKPKFVDERARPTAVIGTASTGAAPSQPGDLNSTKAGPPVATTTPLPSGEDNNEFKNEEYPGWSPSDMKEMSIDPVQYALSHKQVDEEEDYDDAES